MKPLCIFVVLKKHLSIVEWFLRFTDVNEESARTRIVVPILHLFPGFFVGFFAARKMASTRRAVLSLYSRLFRVARTWQAQTGAAGDTETERKYIVQEARTLFRQNQQVETAIQQIQIYKNELSLRLILSSVIILSAYRSRINMEVYKGM